MAIEDRRTDLAGLSHDIIVYEFSQRVDVQKVFGPVDNKKQWASASFASSEQPRVKRDAIRDKGGDSSNACT